MRFSRITKFVLILALAALVLPLSTDLAPRVHAYPPYSLTPVPASTGEGNTVGLVLSNAGAVQNIQYRFRFFVIDAAGTTVQVHAAGYNVSETVAVTIRTQMNSTLVYSALAAASTSGVVVTNWKSPRNAIIDTYIVTLTGTRTVKKTPDTAPFSVRPAVMTIGSITSLKSTYLRTQRMNFSFQPTYPDGSIPSAGIAILILTSASGSNTTLTATYSSMSQTLNATFLTSLSDTGGTWTASLGRSAYSDAYGNSGPGTTISVSSQLTPVTLTISVTTNTSVAVGQQLKFNATITYPDETILQSGNVKAFLVYAGPPSLNDSVPVAYDTASKSWLGAYTIQTSDA